MDDVAHIIGTGPIGGKERCLVHALEQRPSTRYHVPKAEHNVLKDNSHIARILLAKAITQGRERRKEKCSRDYHGLSPPRSTTQDQSLCRKVLSA